MNRPVTFEDFKPKCLPALQRALEDGYQLAIEDIGFTDVCYQSPCSSGEHPYSRWNAEIDISGYLTPDIPLRLPIVSSSMPGVTNHEVAIALHEAGGFAVLPRELPVAELETMIHLFNTEKDHLPWFAAAIGVYPRSGLTAMEKAEKMVGLGVQVVFIETQQANSELVLSFCRELRRRYLTLRIVIGVFNSIDGVRRAAEAGANAVKVGG